LDSETVPILKAGFILDAIFTIFRIKYALAERAFHPETRTRSVVQGFWKGHLSAKSTAVKTGGSIVRPFVQCSGKMSYPVQDSKKADNNH